MGHASKTTIDHESSTQAVEEYDYDNRNQLILSTSGSSTVTNTYNAEGLRVSKVSVEGGVITTEKYLYEGTDVILTVDGSNVQTARNVWGMNLISRDGGTKVYMLYNGHKDVTALVDEAGVIVGTYYYDAFGVVLSKTGTNDNPYGYSGYEYDEETGLYYLKARFYDPATARFLQEDIYLGNGFDPLSLNLYTYCKNNPIIYWDPTGHWEEGDEKRPDWVQAEILLATADYVNADTDEKRAAARQRAEDARNGKTDPTQLDYDQDEIRDAKQTINGSNKVSSGAKQSLAGSDIWKSTNATSVNKSFDDYRASQGITALRGNMYVGSTKEILDYMVGSSNQEKISTSEAELKKSIEEALGDGFTVKFGKDGKVYIFQKQGAKANSETALTVYETAMKGGARTEIYTGEFRFDDPDVYEARGALCQCEYPNGIIEKNIIKIDTTYYDSNGLKDIGSGKSTQSESLIHELTHAIVNNYNTVNRRGTGDGFRDFTEAWAITVGNQYRYEMYMSTGEEKFSPLHSRTDGPTNVLIPGSRQVIAGGMYGSGSYGDFQGPYKPPSDLINQLKTGKGMIYGQLRGR